MAIVKGPALSIEASGNMGAICYSRWRGLQIARDTWTGTYEWSTRREFVRDIMIYVSRYWGGELLPEEREMWEEVARSERWKSRLGDDMIPTGYMLFCKVNCLKFQVDPYWIIERVPPKLPNPVLVKRFWAITDPGAAYVGLYLSRTESRDPIICDGYQVFKAGPYDSGGRRALEGEYRWMNNAAPGWSRDYDVIYEKWYWYKARWFFYVGFVGNFFVKQVQVVYPSPV